MDEMKSIWMNGCRLVFFFFFFWLLSRITMKSYRQASKATHINVGFFNRKYNSNNNNNNNVKKEKLKNRNQWNNNIWCIYSLTITTLIKRRKKEEFSFSLDVFFGLFPNRCCHFFI